MSKSNYAVIGRILFDDEDTIYCYADATREEAVKFFKADMLNGSGRTEQQLIDQHGEDWSVITGVLSSDSVISET